MPIPRITISKAKTTIANNNVASFTSSIAHIADIFIQIAHIADIKIADIEIFSPHTLVHPQLQQLQLR